MTLLAILALIFGYLFVDSALLNTPFIGTIKGFFSHAA